MLSFALVTVKESCTQPNDNILGHCKKSSLRDERFKFQVFTDYSTVCSVAEQKRKDFQLGTETKENGLVAHP